MPCSRTQRGDAGEARTRGPSVSSQAPYHRATALPKYIVVSLYERHWLKGQRSTLIFAPLLTLHIAIVSLGLINTPSENNDFWLQKFSKNQLFKSVPI